jgi:FixJ family two-component response regulator
VQPFATPSRGFKFKSAVTENGAGELVILKRCEDLWRGNRLRDWSILLIFSFPFGVWCANAVECRSNDLKRDTALHPPRRDGMGALLLVDDDRATLSAYTALFAAHDPATKVLTAISAEDAVGLLQTLIFDVVLCDLRLPGRDGLGLLNTTHEIQPDTPFVLVTAYGDLELETDAAKQGAYAVLHKPVDPAVLLSVVKRSILRKRARHAPELTILAASSEDACRDRIQTMNERFSRLMDEAEDEKGPPSH